MYMSSRSIEGLHPYVISFDTCLQARTILHMPTMVVLFKNHVVESLPHSQTYIYEVKSVQSGYWQFYLYFTCLELLAGLLYTLNVEDIMIKWTH